MSLDDKVLEAMHRIEELYNETDGHCYVSFSGGKDSTVLLALIKMCAEIYTLPPDGIRAVYSNTGIELGVTVDFVKWCKENWYPNIEIIRPDVSFDWTIRNKGKPIRSKLKSEFIRRFKVHPTESVIQNLIVGITNSGQIANRTKLADRDMHFVHECFGIKPSSECCEYLKKRPFKKYAKTNGIRGYMTGMRKDEGGARQLNIVTKAMYGNADKICTSISNGIIRKSPIVDWTIEDVDLFIDKYNVPLSKAYTEFNLERTGCMGCPYSRHINKDLKYLYEHEPNRYKASMHWLKDVYIAQNVVLPFDEAYERERERMWQDVYEPMRQEMLRKYRPNSRLIKDCDQLSFEL